MPDSRQHRGPHPEDSLLFCPAQVALLRQAVSDLSLLLSRGYARDSALKLVGDRFNLNKRQRSAIGRSACSDVEQETRLRRLTGTPSDSALYIDGYNVLTILESALAGAPVLLCRDAACRDLAALAGTWRKVQETLPALDLIWRHTCEAGFCACIFLLDRPVSNSGRLGKIILDLAQQQGLDWRVILDSSVDRTLIQSKSLVATSDSYILDSCARWYNLAGAIINSQIHSPWIIDLS